MGVTINLSIAFTKQQLDLIRAPAVRNVGLGLDRFGLGLSPAIDGPAVNR
jgi:hypothetical protein